MQKMLIEKTHLSVRAKNCLQREGYFTVEDIKDLTEEKLLSIRNLGEKTLNEIKAFIECDENWVQQEECEKEPLEAKDFSDYSLEQLLRNDQFFACLKDFFQQNNLSIEEKDLNTRTWHYLQQEGTRSFADILSICREIFLDNIKVTPKIKEALLGIFQALK